MAKADAVLLRSCCCCSPLLPPRGIPHGAVLKEGDDDAAVAVEDGDDVNANSANEKNKTRVMMGFPDGWSKDMKVKKS